MTTTEARHGPLPVRMIHDWKHNKNCSAVVVGRLVSITWGFADVAELSLTTGRLKGSARARMWRMHRTDLKKIRELAGWRRAPAKPQPTEDRCPS